MLFYGSTKREVHLYFHLLTNVQNKNSPEVEKSSGPFETSLKETSLDFPNKTSLWRENQPFHLAGGKIGIPTRQSMHKQP